MTISAEELAWAKTQMNIYGIKYQEIYDEVLDHVLSAIEERRKNGDIQDIPAQFQQVVDDHFDGYRGIDELAARQEELYRKSIYKKWLVNFKYYLNWPMAIITIALILVSFKLPVGKPTEISLLLVILVLAVSPLLYVHIGFFNRLKTDKGRRSLLKTNMISRVYGPALLANSVICLGRDNIAALPLYTQALLVAVFILLNLTCIKFCREMMVKENI